MENSSPHGSFPKHDRRAHSEMDFEVARRAGFGPQSIDKAFPIFSKLNVEPNAYANWHHKYYEDYDAWKSGSNVVAGNGARLLPYVGSKSLPQARYQFADPRFQNFSAGTTADFQSVARSLQQSAPSYASSDASSFVRGGAKQKIDAVKPNRFSPRGFVTHAYSRIYASGVLPEKIKLEGQSNEKRPWYKRKKILLLGGAVFAFFIILLVLTIYFGTLAYKNHDAGSGGPSKGRHKITFAFPFGYSKRSLSEGSLSSQDESHLILDIILHYNDGSTQFALQPYNEKQHEVIQSGSFADSLRDLANISSSEESAVAGNPDLKDCVQAYNKMVANDPAFKHSYVVFLPNVNDYNPRGALDEEMRLVALELKSAAIQTISQKTSVVAVYDSDTFTPYFQRKVPDFVPLNGMKKTFGTVLDEILAALKIDEGEGTASPPASLDSGPYGENFKITFSFPIAHLDKDVSKENLTQMQDRLVAAIMNVILSNNDGKTLFAFQQYGNVSSQKLFDNLDLATALRTLKGAVSETVLGVQPSQHSAISAFRSFIINDGQYQHSYVLFTPEQSDYTSAEDANTDMDKSVQEINSLQNIIQTSKSSALIVCNSWSFDILNKNKELPQNLLIDGNGLDGQTLGKKIVTELSPKENPSESAEYVTHMTLAFNIAHNNGKLRMKRSTSTPTTCEIIFATLAKYTKDNVAITLLPYAGKMNPPVVRCKDANDAVKRLTTVCAINVSIENPDVARAISLYNDMISSNTTKKGQQFYVSFPPQRKDYSNDNDFQKDMQSASDNIQMLARNLKSASNQSSVLIIADAHAASYFGNVPDVGLIDTSGKSVDQIANSVISDLPFIVISPNTTNTTTSTTESTNKTSDGSSPTSSPTPSNTPYTGHDFTPSDNPGEGSSTPTDSHSTTTPVVPTNTTTSASTTTTSEPFVISDSTYSTGSTISQPIITSPSNTSSNTSDQTHTTVSSTTIETPPVNPGTPSTTPERTTKPPIIYPCTGDIVIVFDASTDVTDWNNRNGQYITATMIASHLPLIGNLSTVRVSVASIGAVSVAESLLIQPFYNNYTHLNDAIIRVAANLPGPVITPMRAGTILEEHYCGATDAAISLNPNTPTTFIIFSGWPGNPPTPINSPWFNCSTATDKKVFMVGIEKSTEKLQNFSIPSSFYHKMNEFTEKAMEQLSEQIASNVCGDPQMMVAGREENPSI